MLIDLLNHIGYFKYNTPDEKNEFEKAIQLYSSNRTGLNKLINKFTFAHDKRSFLADHNIDKSTLDIDQRGRDDKWEEFCISAGSGNKIDFIDFLQVIGLSIAFDDPIKHDEKSELNSLIVSINGLTHTIEYPYLQDELLLFSFTEIINRELSKIKSPEKCYIIGRFPSILLFVTEEIYQYLTQLETDNYSEILKPEEWIRKFEKPDPG
ncbi:hypothetical protein [Chryseobacterium shigense]|uniref:Uncharacterized protein n=1 Tax=Chryseobacterium shigense TaxID=297244 RepID=A0A841N7B5_9FLAO|nr:hypothetical protein [Chryseobacterium shigense]MBB6372467.1 hypothetical protein [Chryseobacterium shigense]